MVIKVVLADDHPLTREGFKSYLENRENIKLVGEASDGESALNVIKDQLPDVALIDIRMPGIDGVTLVRQIRQEELRVACLMLTSYDAQQYVLASLRAGAKGYILKTASPEELLRAIEIVASQGVYLDKEVAAAVEEPGFTPESLSPREREVLLLAGRGESSKEIASKLYISERTVQTHLASIYDKLGARNKTEALLLALKYGVVTLEELLE
ncbi:two component transcriptional regulator, LuxR family [Acetomicrobium thermoterrenum DSM 13490]|uniref:Two component transcriptional regulator, LuxR family n=1 Tax=Acetomicrobium thermoterrenum DSM 13490 TaxID=1120987 RepID=A0A1H3HB40_9BACT|nr:response regulator transcription factor [Acetomicrobium thermoterrenum]SDY12627.1 two component transcriptional regulator, LuxR family [Acetomicrobium thermoterrenum DSM 13490]